MGKHKDWRRLAKRERRRRIRTQLARKRDEIYNNEKYVKEQELLHTIELEIIKIKNAEEYEKWLNAEKIAIHQWQLLQEKQKMMHQARVAKEAKCKLEWELEKQKRKAEAERLKTIEEKNRMKQESFMKALEEFVSGDSVHPPKELLITRETKPHADLCPFFSKTACCRFGDRCSRSHKYHGISTTLLATNFYDHFGLNNTSATEYDTDVMLEYEDNETYMEFKEFFYDVLGEFEKFGKILHFKVCNNYEKHLRGNVYVQYERLRCAVAAYRGLHARWYAGRQLSLQFCHLDTWKNALCGMQLNKRCPKGRNCNYLHVFRNPDNMFERCDTSERDAVRSPSRTWRWSESPPLETKRKSKTRDRSRDNRKNHISDSEYSDESCSDDDSKRDYNRNYSKRKSGKEDRRRRTRKRDSLSVKIVDGRKYYDFGSDNGASSGSDRNSDDDKSNRGRDRKSGSTRHDRGHRRRSKSRTRRSYKRKSRNCDRKYDDSDSYSDSDKRTDYDEKKSSDRKYDGSSKSINGQSVP